LKDNWQIAVIRISEGSLGRFRTKFINNYADVLIQDKSKYWPKRKDSRVAKLQVGIEDWNGDIVEYAREDDLDD
jgi:hypothetical protein